MKFSRLLRSATEFLDSQGIADAAADAEIMLLHSLKTDRLAAYRDDPEVSSSKEGEVHTLLARRAAGEPVQYIVGHVEFFGLFIKVGRGVLIPRPETELLVQEAIKAVQSSRFKVQKGQKKLEQGTLNIEPLRILDLCTGSGCIALALAGQFPDAEVFATDVSGTALEYARENATVNRIANAVFLKGSLFDPLPGSVHFDLIVSNPPYIKKTEIRGLQREVRDWEPLEALNGGDDGLLYYRKIFEKARSCLNKNGRVLIEIGFGQAEDIRKIAKNYGFRDIIILPDFAGIPRVLSAE